MAENERIPAEILRKVRRIELSTRNLVDDLFGGEYHSVFKGMGMEFDEVREYTPGDEVRSIDWNVTARMGRPFVKRYREERELTVLLVVDASASGLFGSVDRFKSEVIAEVASVLAFSAIRNQDKVGCLIFTDRVEKYIPPEKGHRHVLRIIRELLYFKPEGSGTDLGGALETISRLLKRKAVVFLLSDFFAEGYETPLRLAARRHDLIALSIHDPLERELPDVGLLHLRDAETGKDVWLDTSSRWVRKHFAATASERRQHFSQLCGRHGVDEIPLDVSGDYVRPLVRFFRQRLKRISKGIGRGTKIVLLAGLLLATAKAEAPAQAQPPRGSGGPPPRSAPPGPPGAIPGGPPGPAQGTGPMQAQPQGMPVIPREQLEKLPLPTLAEITADARPRLSEQSDEGFRVRSRLDRDLQAIGERNELSWTFVLEGGAELLPVDWDLGEAGRIQPWPELGEDGEPDPLLAAKIGGGQLLGIADFFLADTLRGSGADTLRYRLAFTTFLPDTFRIPAQHIAYRLPGDQEPRLVETEPLELACIATLALGPDSSALRDWKAPGELRAEWWPVLARWGLPLILVLGLLAGLAWWWWRRRVADSSEPFIAPDVEALTALEELALEDLPARGAFAEYYFRLSQITRRYLGRRFVLPFPDWTSEEIRLALEPPSPRLVLAQDLREPLLSDLDRGDLVKFAQRKPSRAECLDSMQYSRRLVKATRLLTEERPEDSLEVDAPELEEPERKEAS